MFTKNQIKILAVFYKSTLMLSISSSVMVAAMSFLHPTVMILAFGVCFLSVGTVVTLLYKETTKQHEYYFFYNMGISKRALLLTCILGNSFIGALFISIFTYAQHS